MTASSSQSSLPGTLPPGGSAALAPARCLHALFPRVWTHRPPPEPSQVQPAHPPRPATAPSWGEWPREGGGRLPQVFLAGFGTRAPCVLLAAPQSGQSPPPEPSSRGSRAASDAAHLRPRRSHAVPVLQPVTPGPLVAGGGAQALRTHSAP